MIGTIVRLWWSCRLLFAFHCVYNFLPKMRCPQCSLPIDLCLVTGSTWGRGWLSPRLSKTSIMVRRWAARGIRQTASGSRHLEKIRSSPGPEKVRPGLAEPLSGVRMSRDLEASSRGCQPELPSLPPGTSTKHLTSPSPNLPLGTTGLPVHGTTKCARVT